MNSWRSITGRFISPGEFLRQGRLPLAQRSQGWWDVAGVAGGALAGYIWFVYSSIRGYSLNVSNDSLRTLYDFIQAAFLASLPVLVFFFRGRMLAALDALVVKIKSTRGMGLRAMLWSLAALVGLYYLLSWLLGTLFTFREGIDFLTLGLMAGIPLGLALFRREVDWLLIPLQPLRRMIPRFLLLGIALATPYALAFVLYPIINKENGYEVMHWNVALGILIPYILMRTPQPSVGTTVGPSGGGATLALLLLTMATQLMDLLLPGAAHADDCLADPFNLRDCLRTDGFAQNMSGLASTLVSILVNGPEIIHSFVPPAPHTVDEVGDILWTGPDGRQYVLQWSPNENGYINILSGGFIPRDGVETWKQKVCDQVRETDAWREHNQWLNAAGLDAQSQAMAGLDAQTKARDQAMALLSRLEQDALGKGLWNPGGPGDVVGKCEQMMKDIQAGKPLDPDLFAAARRFVDDRLSGAAADASILKNQEGFLDIARDGLLGTVRETFTGQDAHGDSTLGGFVASMGTRVVMGIATGLISEAVYVGANTVYAAKDSYDRGESGGTMFMNAASTLGWQVAPTVLGIGAAKLLPRLFPGVSQGLSEMIEPVADAVKKADQAVIKASNSLGNRLKFTKLQYLDGMSAGKVEQLERTRKAVTQVLESGEPAELTKLYSKDGMKRLAELQKNGLIANEEVKQLNAGLLKQVNKQIDTGMAHTLDQFEGQTNVRVNEAILGDSGSSARPGGNTKALTDYDSTTVIRFNKEDLAKYAQKNGLTMEQADQALQKQFANQLTDNVDTQLRAQGFEGGAGDVDFKTYAGFNKGFTHQEVLEYAQKMKIGYSDALQELKAQNGMPRDTYPDGITGCRQSVTGKGTVYERTETGELRSRTVSGQTVVDQHGLNTQAVTGKLPENPTKFGADEFFEYSDQQVIAATEHSDVKSLSKALGRESKLSQQLQRMAEDPASAGQLSKAGLPVDPPPTLDGKLTDIASQIEKNPDNALEILKNSGFKDEQSFVEAGRQEITRYHNAITPQVPGTPS